MKITKSQLVGIIKEEIQLMLEADAKADPRKKLVQQKNKLSILQQQIKNASTPEQKKSYQDQLKRAHFQYNKMRQQSIKPPKAATPKK